MAIPLIPPSDQMTAPDLLAAADLPEEEFEAEMAAWLELRAPDVAAGELLAAAAVGDPGERLLAVAAVQKLSAAAEPAWRDALARPELRPYAKIALTELAGGEPGITVLPGLEPEAADLAWVLIDTLAVTSDDPDDLQQQMRDAIPAVSEGVRSSSWSLSRRLATSVPIGEYSHNDRGPRSPGQLQRTGAPHTRWPHTGAALGCRHLGE